MTAMQIPKPRARRAPLGILAGVVALGLVIFALHGRSLGYGLFMDDYAHFRQLQECDWSMGGLAQACRLELVGGVIELWWLPECTLRFFRPVAFGLMKLTYTLVGWNAAPMHVASLLWHTAACTLLMLLLRRMGVGSGLAWVVAALFAIHPAHVATVQWIAAQSELMVTTFLLAGLLCYSRFRDWPGGTRGHWGWAVACASFYAVALGCRENALLFPIVVAALEPWLKHSRTRATNLWVGALFVVGVLYLVLRGYYLGGAELPPRPYVVPPGDPTFLRYVFDKACYYLLGEFLLVPCVPIGGLPYLRERPLVFYGLALAVVLLVVVVCARRRQHGGGALAVAWLSGFMLPVLPVFESPHHLYLPGIGWAVVIALLVRRAAVAARRWRVVAVVGMATCGVVFGVLTFFFGMALDVAQQVEDRVAAEISVSAGGLHDGDTLYVVNLPIIAHYAKLAVEERTGVRDLRVIALTWAPRLLGLAGTETSAELTWIDERTIDVRVAGGRYFTGPLARLVAEAGGAQNPLDRTGPLACDGLQIELLECDDHGVAALRFVFDYAPGRNGVHLYWGSRACWAFEVYPEERADGGR